MKLVVLLSMLLIPNAAYASFFTGNDLLRLCTSDNLLTFGQCLGYIQSVADFQSAFRAVNDQDQCIPSTVEAGQLKDVVVAYLQQNPKSRDIPGAALVVLAVADAWPCAGPANTN